jgi:hypothetical protein
MTKARKVAILQRAYARAHSRGWTPGVWADRVPTLTSAPAVWEAFLQSRQYVFTLLNTPELTDALWDTDTADRHRSRLWLLLKLQSEDAMFVHLAELLAALAAAKEAA